MNYHRNKKIKNKRRKYEDRLHILLPSKDDNFYQIQNSPTMPKGALQLWQKHCSTESRTRPISIFLAFVYSLLPANRGRYLAKLKSLAKTATRMKKGSAEESARGHVQRARRKAGSGWTRIWGGGWRATDPHSAPRRRASLNIHRLAPLAPLVVADHSPLQRVAYPTTSHPSTSTNLQPPTSTSSNLNMPISWTRLPVARHVWKLRGGVKYHLSNSNHRQASYTLTQPRTTSLLINGRYLLITIFATFRSLSKHSPAFNFCNVRISKN